MRGRWGQEGRCRASAKGRRGGRTSPWRIEKQRTTRPRSRQLLSPFTTGPARYKSQHRSPPRGWLGRATRCKATFLPCSCSPRPRAHPARHRTPHLARSSAPASPPPTHAIHAKRPRKRKAASCSPCTCITGDFPAQTITSMPSNSEGCGVLSLLASPGRHTNVTQLAGHRRVRLSASGPAV